MNDPQILSLIFVMHNVEEYLSFDHIVPFAPVKSLWNKRSFAFSLLLLSLLVLTISFFSFPLLQKIVLVALLLNAFQHCIFSILYKKIVPGTYTAFLLFPYCLFYLWHLFEAGELDVYSTLGYFFLALPLTFLLIGSSLWLGNRLSRRD